MEILRGLDQDGSHYPHPICFRRKEPDWVFSSVSVGREQYTHTLQCLKGCVTVWESLMETRGPDISCQGQVVSKLWLRHTTILLLQQKVKKILKKNVRKPSFLEYCHCNHGDPVWYRIKKWVGRVWHNILETLIPVFNDGEFIVSETVRPLSPSAGHWA